MQTVALGLVMMILLLSSSAVVVVIKTVLPSAHADYVLTPVEVRSGGGSAPPPPPPCSVSISGSTSPLLYNGLPRNNPDGTYYPGDGFLLYLSIEASYCSSTSVSITGDSDLYAACSSCASTAINVSPYASFGSHTISAFVSGSGPGGSGFASTSLSIVVANPMITFKITPANVTDKDGYIMRNADDSHYINDAIALKYQVNYAFKDQRRGLVEPEVTRTHPYPHIADLDCLQESCTLVVPVTSATSEYSANYDYASGISVANATASQGLGAKIFQFDVRMKNAGVYTGMHASQKYTASIVNYAPLFIEYPYLNLKNGSDDDVSFEKKLMIGLHYLGSSSDIDGTIQPLRRTKINSYTNEVDASVFGVQNIDRTKNAGLSWLSVGPVDSSSVITTTSPGKNAMIERAGYVKLAMKLNNYNANVFATMQNVTALPIFYSKDFAGKNSVVLFGVGYIYPDTRFANTISIKVVDESSNIVANRPLSLKVSPASDSTTTVCAYVGAQAKDFTGDSVFSKIALSDVYSCSPAFLSGTGTLTMHANMTGLLIPQTYGILYPGGVQTMPANIVFESPASQTFKVTVDGGQSNTYSLPVYSYEKDVKITANIGTNNILNTTRNGSTVTVKAPDNFGSITRLQVNGTDIINDNNNQFCTNGCTLDIAGPSKIVASNEWGGKASAFVSAPIPVDSSVARIPNVLVENNGQNVILAIFGVVGAVIAGVVLRKYASLLGGLFG